MFHRIPKMLTSVLSAAVFSLEALAVSNWLLDAQTPEIELGILHDKSGSCVVLHDIFFRITP